jgi:hypothetical protein
MPGYWPGGTSSLKGVLVTGARMHGTHARLNALIRDMKKARAARRRWVQRACRGRDAVRSLRHPLLRAHRKHQRAENAATQSESAHDA